jgi:hypothetical protein
MKKFTLNEKEYNMPTCWDDMSLGIYVKLAKLDEEKQAFGMPELYLLKIIEALCCAEPNELDDLTLDLVGELSNEVGYLNNEPKWSSSSRHLLINDVDYAFPEDLNKLTMGEYISIKMLQEQQNTQAELIPYLLAVILRPAKKVINEETKKENWICEKFNTENLEWRKELFLTQPVFNLMGPVSFFLNGSGTSIINTKVSTPEA